MRSLLAWLLLFFSTLTWAQISPLSVDSNTLSLWNFNTDTSTSVLDSAPTPLNGVATNTSITAIPGLSGSFLTGRRFTQSSSKIDFGPTKNSKLDFSGFTDLSFEVVVYIEGTNTAFATLFDNGQLNISIIDDYLAVFVRSTSGQQGLISENKINQNTAYRISVEFDHGNLGVTLNGQSIGSVLTSSTIIHKSSNQGEHVILGGNFTGYIDDIRISSIARADIVPPTLAINSPDISVDVTTGLPNFDITLVDNQSGVDATSVKIYLNGVLQTGLVITSTSISGTLDSPLIRGNNDFKINLADMNGNKTLFEAAIVFDDGSPLPPVISTSVSSQGEMTCSLSDEKQVWCWGNTVPPTFRPVLIEGLNDVEEIAVGENHACARNNLGEVFCFGQNSFGQLGSTASSGMTPVKVTNLESVKKIAAGNLHTCAILNDNTVKCWGSNFFGQLGNFSGGSSSIPLVVSGLTNASQISLGQNISCAIFNAGKIKCWGWGEEGNLGNGAYTTSMMPVEVTNITNAIKLDVGHGSTCAILSDNSLWCWGKNDYGQLGANKTAIADFSISLSNGGRTPLVAHFDAVNSYLPGHEGDPDKGIINCHWRFGLGGGSGDKNTKNKKEKKFIEVDGCTADFNITNPGFYPVTLIVFSVDGGFGVITKNFQATSGAPVASFSVNPPSGTANAPVQVVPDASDSYLPGHETELPYRGISFCTWSYTSPGTGDKISIKDDSCNPTGGPAFYFPTPGMYQITLTVHAVDGQIASSTQAYFVSGGTGDKKNPFAADISTPLGQPVLVNTVSNVNDVFVGAGHTCVIKNDASMWCWGRGDSKQLGNHAGNHSQTAVQVLGVSNVIGISNGREESFAVLADGSIYAWGLNTNGKLGTGSSDNTINPTFIDFNTTGTSAQRYFTKIAAGTGNSCGILDDKTIRCWGYGQAGNFSGYIPVVIKEASTNAPLENVIEIGIGFNHACALVQSGDVYCWGGFAGPFAVKVTDISSVMSISVGTEYTCAVKNDGTAWCWGRNDFGQLGDGTFNQQSTPVQVLNVTGITKISASLQGTHTCATLNTGKINCWGRNDFGQLGNGLYANSNVAVEVADINNAISVSTSSLGTCALLSTGKVKCWGRNDDGQLGDGTTINSEIPVEVSNLSGVIAIKSGGENTCALKNNMNLVCWGQNVDGELGNAGSVDSPIPVTVKDLFRVTDFDVGESHSCAVLSNGVAKCWGFNGQQQVGQGNTVIRTPINIVLVNK